MCVAEEKNYIICMLWYLYLKFNAASFSPTLHYCAVIILSEQFQLLCACEWPNVKKETGMKCIIFVNRNINVQQKKVTYKLMFKKKYV
jgi:hypothetical protein